MKVKWGRENYPSIDVNTDEEPLLFKAQLFALTGVQPERQKVMCKGVALKDGVWNIQLKDVSVLDGLGLSSCCIANMHNFPTPHLFMHYLGLRDLAARHQRRTGRRAR